MAKTDITRNKIKAKISAIKKISDDPKSLVDTTYDAYKDQLESINGIVKKNVTDFTSKLKGGTQNRKDIFEEIIDISESFLGNDKEDPINPKSKPLVKKKILRYAKESALKVLNSSKSIINDESKKVLFGGTGLCNPATIINTETLTISPKEFDFLNMLKVNPDSITGKLMYENEIPNVTGDIKFNRELYNNFDSGAQYHYIAKDGGTLFSILWDSSAQQYNVSSMSSTTMIGDFLDNYYNALEFPDIEHIFKTALYMTLGGEESEPSGFKDGMKNSNRLIQKLFSLCGKPSSKNPLLNNTSNELVEDEYDEQNLFDFDDTNGVDMDEENNVYNRVLKFRDCNNFEVPLNENYPEDFVYLLNKQPIDENVFNTLNKAAQDAYEQSDSSVTLDQFQLSLTAKYILKIPRALITSILSPKMFYPIILMYKAFKGSVVTMIKEMMKTLYKFFMNVIKKLFWLFIKEFWLLIKRDLLDFVKKVAYKILMNKLKKIKMIVQILINIIRRVLTTKIGSCTEIFNAILEAINAAINKSIKIPIPGALLVLSELLPGFSSDRAYINIVERLESSGINMGPIYGSENKLPLLIKGIVDGYSEEVDTNSYVKIALKSAVVGAGTNGYGIIAFAEGVGKQF